MLVHKAPWKLAIALTFFALGGRAFAGCGGPPGADICILKCECEGCSIAKQNECLDEVDRDANEASRIGCYDFYGDLRACEAATGRCREGKDWRTDCDAEEHRWHNCREH